MAAYAALVSLTNIIDQILTPSTMNRIIVLRKKIEFLQENVTFLIEFLEKYSITHSKEVENLGTRIVNAAYEAEDIIESYVIDQILEGSALINRDKSSNEPCEGVQFQTIIDKFQSIRKELEMVFDKKGVDDQRTTTATSSRPLISGKISTVVGFEEHLIQIMSALTTDEPDLQIIPIVGMGGIGKTTLATNVYNHPFVTEHFHIHAWITISQEYTVRELLLGLLHQVRANDMSEDLATFSDKMSMKSDEQLGEQMYKELFERKYLIVMDDMWNVEAWYNMKRFLPDNLNGSRVLVTTRLLKLGVDLGSSSPYKMGFLNEEKSWDLLREKVFAKEGCPDELEKIGRRVAKRCGGLPLALTVIAGLLAKSERTKESWEYIEGDIASFVSNEHDELIVKILYLSYNNLPINLKPCFLYLAVFPEDFEICRSRLVKLWVAEGLIKPTLTNKTTEEVAENYFEDLVDRNLVLVRKLGSGGKVKSCSIHDLLRDMCKREAHKDKFLRVAKLENLNVSPYIESERRLSIHHSAVKENVYEVLKSARLNRSLLSYFKWNSDLISRGFRLLRIVDTVDGYSEYEIRHLINSRYISCTVKYIMKAPVSLPLHFFLQTLIVDGYFTLPPGIWLMPRLRHIKIRLAHAPNPPDGLLVLENLQTFSMIENLTCSESIFKRIPNVKKLGIGYRGKCLNNLVHLYKLESLSLKFYGPGFWRSIAFPCLLKKLTLRSCMIPWEGMSVVGSLPNLEVLKLLPRAVKGLEWKPNEGEFGRLKYLMIDHCDLEVLRADSTHFPCLEMLLLGNPRLKKLPLGFAEIPTLRVIRVQRSIIPVKPSIQRSVQRISKERESLGYEIVDFQVVSTLI